MSVQGCLELLDRSGIEISGKRAVVVGRSTIVGTPVAMLLTNRDATVTVLHSRSQNAAEICATADIVIAAVGKPEVVKADWVKPGAAVIDVGTNAVPVSPLPPVQHLMGVGTNADPSETLSSRTQCQLPVQSSVLNFCP